MNIPPKYEDVVANLDAALAREAALRESLTDKREEYNKIGDRYDAIQQRLTVAEQREAELEGLLREVANLDPRGEFLGWQLDGKIEAALKPAAEVAAYCTHPPGCKQCSWCGFKAESKLAAEGEGS